MSGLSRRSVLAGVLAAGSSAWPPGSFAQGGAPPSGRMQSWRLMTPQRTGIHDLAPASDGGVWFTAQRSGHLGWFDPKNGQTELIALRCRSRPLVKFAAKWSPAISTISCPTTTESENA